MERQLEYRVLGRLVAAICTVALGLAWTAAAGAQTRVLPLGDSITHGGQSHASYRYTLWLDLEAAGYEVDFVGRQTEIFGGDPPNLAWYPLYETTFDPDHEGHWGNRTDEIFALIDDAADQSRPDVALVHLGTNDIGQNGAQGVTDADTYLRLIIARLRVVNPEIAVLLARVIPIGAGSGYSANAGQVGPLNAVIDQIAIDLDSTYASVSVVDLNAGFDLLTMMQTDGLHPNVTGEDWMADQWETALATRLVTGNLPPSIAITSPLDASSAPSAGAIDVVTSASDPDGSLSAVRLYVDGQLVGEVTTPPYTLPWTNATLGSHELVAVAEDDQGATSPSLPIGVTVVTPGSAIAVPILNPSFEVPVTTDGQTTPGPGVVGDWTFAASANTFVGIFNPPAGSYPTAGGSGTATGADGINAAYLFNNGGPAEFVEATQALSETLLAGHTYQLWTAIGRFLPGQPFVPSSYGGYTIELIAGTTVIAQDTDTIDPPVGEFRDAVAVVDSDAVDPSLIGQPLSIRLTISSTDAPRSTHFDDVRLTRTPHATIPVTTAPGIAALVVALIAAARARRR